MGLFISFYFLAIIMGILFYYLVSTYSVKISAFLIDFIIVGFSIYFALEHKVSLKISIPLSILGVFVYGIILILINQKLPFLGKFINYVAAFIGASVALYLALDFITNALTLVGILKDSFTKIPFTKVDGINTFINYVIAFFISLPIYKGRMKFINGE